MDLPGLILMILSAFSVALIIGGVLGVVIFFITKWLK